MLTKNSTNNLYESSEKWELESSVLSGTILVSFPHLWTPDIGRFIKINKQASWDYRIHGKNTAENQILLEIHMETKNQTEESGGGEPGNGGLILEIEDQE